MMLTTGTIQIEVPDCPAVVPNVMGIPSWVIGSGMGLTFVIVLAAIVAMAYTYNTRKLEQTRQLADRRSAEVSMAKLKKHCDTCGADYQPAVLA